MPEAPLRIETAPEAEQDLHEIVEYWSVRGEAWRGEKYFRDLTDIAHAELSDIHRARRGRFLRSKRQPLAREFLAFGVYRIIYRIDEEARAVKILRFWHAHRDTPELD